MCVGQYMPDHDTTFVASGGVDGGHSRVQVLNIFNCPGTCYRWALAVNLRLFRLCLVHLSQDLDWFSCLILEDLLLNDPWTGAQG